MEERITAVFNGINFIKHPKSKYFRCHSGYHKQGIRYLHHEVWKSVHGEIPAGYHIHHIDGNALNNSIENLECITAAKHLSAHSKKRFENKEWAADFQRKGIAAAPTWHKSAEGKEWHTQQWHKSLAKAFEPQVKQCEVCSKQYNDVTSHKSARFCSNACKSKWRRDSGIDNVERICRHCSNKFTAGKYSKVAFCSKSCSASFQHNSRRST